MAGTYEIIYRVPGTMTMRETDSTADAIQWVDAISNDPRATLISVDYTEDPEV